jgi:NADPH:quinone reductase-like Zn-dependent oxidoreductase
MSFKVRVKINTCGVAFADTLIRKGVYPGGQPKFPLTLGYEAVGIVQELGKNVKEGRLKIGDTVAVLSVIGCHAEEIQIEEDCVFKVSANLDRSKVLALVLNYITAYQMLTRVITMKKGERILVHGISGGVGTALLELGKYLELEVYGTCSSSKFEAVKNLGGHPIDYKTEDFVSVINKLDPPGVDAVFDPIGGDHLYISST